MTGADLARTEGLRVVAEPPSNRKARGREILRAALRQQLPGRDLFEMLHIGPRLPQGVDADAWRSSDPGEPAEL